MQREREMMGYFEDIYGYCTELYNIYPATMRQPTRLINKLLDSVRAL